LCAFIIWCEFIDSNKLFLCVTGKLLKSTKNSSRRRSHFSYVCSKCSPIVSHDVKNSATHPAWKSLLCVWKISTISAPRLTSFVPHPIAHLPNLCVREAVGHQGRLWLGPFGYQENICTAATRSQKHNFLQRLRSFFASFCSSSCALRKHLPQAWEQTVLVRWFFIRLFLSFSLSTYSSSSDGARIIYIPVCARERDFQLFTLVARWEWISFSPCCVIHIPCRLFGQTAKSQGAKPTWAQWNGPQIWAQTSPFCTHSQYINTAAAKKVAAQRGFRASGSGIKKNHQMRLDIKMLHALFSSKDIRAACYIERKLANKKHLR